MLSTLNERVLLLLLSLKYFNSMTNSYHLQNWSTRPTHSHVLDGWLWSLFLHMSSVGTSVSTSVPSFQNKTNFKRKQCSLLARLWVWPSRSLMTPVLLHLISEGPIEPPRRQGRFFPASRPTVLFIRPLYDVSGRRLNFDNSLDEENLAETLHERTAAAKNKASSELPDNDLIDQLGNAVLPLFGHQDILLATEELRSRDKNQISFIEPGNTNAGLLPLVNEDIGSFNLFPPLRPARRLPKK